MNVVKNITNFFSNLFSTNKVEKKILKFQEDMLKVKKLDNVSNSTINILVESANELKQELKNEDLKSKSELNKILDEGLLFLDELKNSKQPLRSTNTTNTTNKTKELLRLKRNRQNIFTKINNFFKINPSLIIEQSDMNDVNNEAQSVLKDIDFSLKLEANTRTPMVEQQKMIINSLNKSKHDITNYVTQIRKMFSSKQLRTKQNLKKLQLIKNEARMLYPKIFSRMTLSEVKQMQRKYQDINTNRERAKLPPVRFGDDNDPARVSLLTVTEKPKLLALTEYRKGLPLRKIKEKLLLSGISLEKVNLLIEELKSTN